MNVRSMTGYGRSETLTEEYRLVVDIKSVNHRFLDLNIRMPRLFNRFEASIRSLLKTYIERGKVDLFITYEDYLRGESGLKYNRVLAGKYLEYCREMSREFGIEDDVRVSTVARFPDVFTMDAEEIDEDKLRAELAQGLKDACVSFVEARQKEGENLRTDILGKLADMRKALAVIEEKAPEILQEYKTNLRQKVTDLLGETTLDENRIAQEVTIYADRICVDEEMVRLHSHIDTMEKDLKAGGTIGRKLDFLAQEMNREANTTLSKSTDLTVADNAIFLKTTIEKIREQIQNIE